MESCIIAVLVICSLTVPAFGDKGTSKVRSCSDIKLFYSGKGFALDGVPQSEISGKPRQKPSGSFTFRQLNILSHKFSRRRRSQNVFNMLKLRLLLLGNHNLSTGPHRNVDLFWGQSYTCSRWHLLSPVGVGVKHTQMMAALSSAWGFMFFTTVVSPYNVEDVKKQQQGIWILSANTKHQNV